MADPAHPGRAGDGHGQDVGVGQRHDHRGQRVDEVPVDQAPGQHVAEVPEDESAGAHGELGAALEQPHRQPAGNRDDERYAQEPVHAPVRGEQPEDEQRPRVPLDVLPVEVQERRGEDLRQPPDVTRQDAVVLVEPVMVGPVEDLEQPDQADEPDHEEERLPGLGQVDLGGPDGAALTSPGLTRHALIVHRFR